MSNSYLKVSDYRDFGTNAYQAYVALCKEFGWDKSAGEKFRYKKSMSAKNVTREGYSVAFYTYSNVNNEHGDNTWTNRFVGDELIIGNTFFYKGIWSPDTKIVFVKDRENGYRFFGVYRFKNVKKNNDGSNEKIYTKISSVYPE